MHGASSEHASKLVRDLRENITGEVLSIENRKGFSERRNEIVLPKLFSSNILRKFFQAVMLPIYLTFLRTNHKTIFTFWTPNGGYHYLLFMFLKIIRYDIIFTVISGYGKNYSCLRYCDSIVCQSNKMTKFIRSMFPNKKIFLIYPWTDLRLFNPGNKKNLMLVPSVPYKIADFEERGIWQLIKILKENKIKAKVIFRSKESFDYFKGLKLENVECIYKILRDYELAEIMKDCKVIPLLYNKDAPDMPLSAIEGLSSGCAIVCTSDLGLSEIIEKEGAGIISDKKGFGSSINKALKENFNSNARKAAEKYFKKENIKNYIRLIEGVNFINIK